MLYKRMPNFVYRSLNSQSSLLKFLVSSRSHFTSQDKHIPMYLSEIDHVETCELRNNLTLNWKKSTKIVFVDTRRKSQVAASLPMAGILRFKLLKVLDDTISNGLSASDHVRGVVTNCSQTLYVLRVLSTHGISDLALPSSSTRAMLGGASPMRPTDSESTPSCSAVFIAATIHLICLHSKSCTRLPANSSSPKS